MGQQWGFVCELDNLILNSYWRRFYTYRKLGWDDASITEYLRSRRNHMQIASFNTSTVTFTASSRRNRFYEIYETTEMLECDVLWDNVIPALNRIAERYKIFVISSRSEELKEKTITLLQKYHVPVDLLTFFFRKATDGIHTFRKTCFEQIHRQFSQGICIALSESEIALIQQFQYLPVAFLSVAETEDFHGKVQAICSDWNQVLQVLQLV